MKNWTIKRLIALGFAAVVAITLFLGLFAWMRLATIREGTKDIATDALPGLSIITKIQSLAQQNYSATLRIVLAENADAEKGELMEIQKNIATINGLTNNYAAIITDDKDRKLFGAMLAARAEYVPAFKEVCRLNAEQNTTEALHVLRAKLNPASLKFLGTIDAVVVLNRAQAEAAVEKIDGSVRSAKAGILAGVIAAFIVALVIALVIIRAVNGVLRDIAGSLSGGSDQLASAAGQVSASSQILAEGSSEQAASIEETSSSLEELSSMTKRNAENSQKATDLAGQARQAADKGVADMQIMNAAMLAIKNSSDDIAKIIRTIDEIAFQTNILALNAAVEAARAGEAGMGFAVVADEVRNLAQRSAQAARETAAKIEGAISKTAQGVGISQQVSETLNEIVIKARQVDELAAEVAGASREQTQGIVQINTAVGQMDKVIQSNAATAEESAAAAEELNSQAESMKHAVRRLVALVGADGGKSLATRPATRKPESLIQRAVTRGFDQDAEQMFHAGDVPARPPSFRNTPMIRN